MTHSPFLWIDFRQNKFEAGFFELISQTLHGIRVTEFEQITPAIRNHSPLVLCFEFDIPIACQLGILQTTKSIYSHLPIIMITEPLTEMAAAWALRAGIREYLLKPIDSKLIQASIARLIELRKQRIQEPKREIWQISPPASSPAALAHILGQDYRTMPALSFINQRFAETIRLSDVAASCNLSESAFCRLFKKENHITFNDYLLKYRIHKSCQLLENTSIQIKIAAFNVGFNDLSYFARIFRRFMGITPSEYQLYFRAPHNTHLSRAIALA